MGRQAAWEAGGEPQISRNGSVSDGAQGLAKALGRGSLPGEGVGERVLFQLLGLAQGAQHWNKRGGLAPGEEKRVFRKKRQQLLHAPRVLPGA